MPEHLPVLLHEVLHYLNPQPNEDAVDATVNGGGHALALIEKIAPRGRLLGIDRDPEMIKTARRKFKPFGDRVVLAEGTFANIASFCADAGDLHPSRILFDLGFSSHHLASATRGFTFQRDEPLDMRFDPAEAIPNAAAIVSKASFEELTRIFSEYGNERRARRLAEAIVRERKRRPITRTAELVSLILRTLPRGKIHPATKIFQALRIAVNDELHHIERGLEGAWQVLQPGGRLAIITFHSLEERAVKRFQKNHRENLKSLTEPPVKASLAEIRSNPRARSAKLRAFMKKI